MILPQSPCKDCEKRYVGCHSECDDWKEYQKRFKEWKELTTKNRKQSQMQEYGKGKNHWLR